jgi:hypothetical protein
VDCRRALSALLILAAGASTPLPLKEAHWISAERRASVLSTEPGPCIAIPDDPDAEEAMLVGAALFRTPLLLGGQAARSGLSCHSCHRNGRGNPAFLFPGLSGKPGTADVTSSIFSRQRGDGHFNPREIPDLSYDPPKVSRDPSSSELESFIRGLIVEEFDGPEPDKAALSGLATYVRALGAPGCRRFPDERVSAARDLGMAGEAASLAAANAARTGPAFARILVSASRSILGGIHERYRGDELAPQRASLERLDEELRLIQSGIADDPKKASEELSGWQSRLDAASPGIIRAEDRSLYNVARLTAAFHPK